ncbi:MAG: hypothetical protein ACRDYV_17995, partial [Acidimicrobiia bacterium]
MAVRTRSLTMVAMAAVLSLGAGCGDDGGESQESAETSTTMEATTTSAAPVAAVSFAEPADGATVAAPVKVKMQATNFIIEAAGKIKA